jgi:hypothetical protein
VQFEHLVFVVPLHCPEGHEVQVVELELAEYFPAVHVWQVPDPGIVKLPAPQMEQAEAPEALTNPEEHVRHFVAPEAL